MRSAAIFLLLAVGAALIGQLASNEAAPVTYALQMQTDDGNIYTMDYGLTAEDCHAAATDESFSCQMER